MVKMDSAKISCASERIVVPQNPRKRGIEALEQYSSTFTYGEQYVASKHRPLARLRYRDTVEPRRTLSLPDLDHNGRLQGERNKEFVFGHGRSYWQAYY
jgi:hypothetical protein